MADYTRGQIYDAMRRADAAGDGEAVKKLAAALQAGASKPEILDIAKQNNLSVDEAALDANIASRDAGGPTNTFVPPKPAPTLADGIQNAAVGGVVEPYTGTFDFAQNIAKAPTYAMNALTRTIGQGAQALGMDTVGNALIRGANNYDRDLSGMPTATGAVRSVSPVPEGMENSRLAANLIGGLAMPFGPKAAPPIKAPKTITARTPVAQEAADIVAAGEREGVRVLTSDVKPPKTFIGKIARSTGERIPIAGTGGVRVKQNEERINAVKELARDFGIDGSQEILDDVSDDLAKTRGGKVVALKGRKDRVIKGIAQPFDAAPNTVRIVSQEVRRLQGIDPEEYAPVIARLQRFGEQVTAGKTLEQVEGQRKLLGELFADPKLAHLKDEGQKAINAVYAPLRNDMGAFIKANGGDDAFKAWKSSNDELAAMAGDLRVKSFKGVLNDAETTPENVAKLLFSQKPSDVRRLYANLSPAGQEKAKAAVLYEAIRKSGGLDEVSPQKFANALKSFGRTTGVVFGDDAPRIEGIVRLLRATQQASVAAAAPPTGVQNAPVIGAAVLTDWLGGLGSSATVAGLAGAAARLYESAPVRNLLVGLSKTKPGTPAERAVFKRIEAALVSRQGIGPAANDNIGTVTRAAASDGTEPQRND